MLAEAQTAAQAYKPHPSDVFGGWYLLQNGTLTAYNPGLCIYSDIELYPSWINGECYTVSYNLGTAAGTAPSDGETYASGGRAQVKACDLSVVTPPAGMVFAGWRSGTSSVLYYPNSAMQVTANTTLTAQWAPAKTLVGITYDGNGGTLSGGGTTFAAAVPNNTRHTVQENSFGYTGREFVCWNTQPDGGGTAYSPGESVLLGRSDPNAPDTLYAIWRIAFYRVDYAASAGGDTVDNLPESVNMRRDASVTVSGTAPYRSGYHFLYWQTQDIGGAVKTFSPADDFTMPGNDVTLSAVWEAGKSPVYYHPNNGADTTVRDGRYPTDSVVTVSGNLFSRPGYRFIGWSEQSPENAVSRQPGDTFGMPPRQVNFYAQWEQTYYSATYIVTGGTGDTFDGSAPYAVYTSLSYGDPVPAPDDPALSGYVFEGWSGVIPPAMPDGNLTIRGTMRVVEAPVKGELEIIPEIVNPPAGPVWALLNLILAIASALASLLMLIGLAGKKRSPDGLKIKKRWLARLLTLIPGIGGIVAFLLTENMQNAMVFTDRWTLLMIVIAVVQAILTILCARKKADPVPQEN